MFSWIHQSDGIGPPSIEEKRKIRSHVTRTLALQRTINRERAPNDPIVWALDGDSAWRQHQRKRRTASKATNSNVERNSAELLPPKDSGRVEGHSVEANIGTLIDTKANHRTATVVRDNQRHRRPENAVVSQTRSKETFGYKTGPEPLLNMWAIEMPDPGNAMLRLCAVQMHRFRPEVSVEQASDVTGGVWGTSPCQILAYALCLASLGHLHSNSLGHAPDVVAVFKGKVFHEIIRRISAKVAPLSDEMIPSILCLTQFELSRASLECRTHLQALNTIHEIQHLKPQAELPIMFEALDILHSIMFHLPTITGLEMDDTPATVDADNMIAILVEELDVASRLIEEDNSMLLKLKSMFLNLATMIRDILNSSHHEGTNGEILFDELEQFRSTYCIDDQRNIRERYVARNCYHTLAILYDVLVHQRSFRHGSHKNHATTLYVATSAKYVGCWETLSYLHLWIFTIALSSTCDASEQSMFQDRLVTAMYHMGTQAWNGVRSFLCLFLRLRTHLNLRSQAPTPKNRTTKTKARDPHSSHSSRANNLRPPRFIPLSRGPPTARLSGNTQIYPDLIGRYPFSAATDLHPAEDAMTLHKGYAWLSADAKFGKILVRGESGRISFMGVSLPEEGYLALF